MNPFDQSQPGLTGSGEAGTEGAQEKDLVDLPFRFTQWQLNVGNKAATGQWERSGIARSPFQSGQLALEMEGIQSQLKNLPEMNAAPLLPELPEDPQTPSFTPSVATDEATRSVRPNENMNMNMRYGLPLKEYQIPSNMILGSRNPIEAARAFESKYKTPEERAAFGPTTSYQGYDIDAIMKASGWGGSLTEKYQGDENKATQQLFNNLAILPASFDPNLDSKTVQQNLAERDFTYNNQPIQYDPPQLTWVPGTGEGEQGRWEDQSRLGIGEGQMGALAPQNGRLAMTDEEWDQQFKFGQAGEAGTVGQTGFGDFERQVQETIAREIHNGNAISKIAMKYGMAATIAVMAAMTGGAASAAFAPAAGAAAGTAAGGTEAAISAGVAAGADVGMAPAATGLAGTMGMSSGALATTVNNLATMIAKYGVNAAAQAAGIPVDNPLFQMAMSTAGGAVSGATSSAPGATPPPENTFGVRGIENAPVLGDDEFGGMSEWPGAGSMTTPVDYSGLGSKAAQFGLKVGMSEAQAAQMEAEQASQSTQGGQPTYDNEMAAYNTALEEYNKEVAAYEAYRQQLEERSAEVQRLMGAYETDAGNWASRQALTARQTGIQTQIQSSIAGNTAYDPKEMNTGVQGALWK